MTDTNDLFPSENDDSIASDTNDQINRDNLASYLEELVGEGKKFKDAEALAKSKYDSDVHIDKLQRENYTLREELKQRLTAEDLMDKIRSEFKNAKESNSSIPDSNELDDNDNRSNNKTSVTEEDIRKTVIEAINAERERNQLINNSNVVINELQKAWGSDYQSRLVQRARELELGKEFLTNLASTQPTAFLKLVLGDSSKAEQRDGDVFTPPDTRRSSQQDSYGNVRNYKYYQKIRREDPARYRSPSLQEEMHEQATKMGDAFYQ